MRPSQPLPDSSPVDEAKIIADLPREQYDFLFKNAPRKRYAKNGVIYAPEDRGAYVYYVVKGGVKIFSLSGDGREIIYRICNPRTIFGLSSVFGGQLREVFAQAVGDTEVLCARRESFEKLILRNPVFAVAIIHVLGHRLRQAHAAITEFVVGDVRSRIAQLLAKLANVSTSARGEAVTIENKLTHQEIASMIGATRTTVTKVLNGWKRLGVVRAVRGRIVIVDYPAIRDMIHR